MRTCSYTNKSGQERCTECGITTDLCTCIDVSFKAHNRLWSPEGRVLRAVRDEIDRARELFPQMSEGMVALMEEVGELANALIEHQKGNKPSKAILEEAIQVAAVAIRIAIEGDERYPHYDSTPFFVE